MAMTSTIGQSIDMLCNEQGLDRTMVIDRESNCLSLREYLTETILRDLDKKGLTFSYRS